jgi:hypothetical protein
MLRRECLSANLHAATAYVPNLVVQLFRVPYVDAHRQGKCCLKCKPAVRKIVATPVAVGKIRGATSVVTPR